MLTLLQGGTWCQSRIFDVLKHSRYRFARLGSYGGEDSPLDISRVRTSRPLCVHFNIYHCLTQGLYAGEVGVPRLLKLFEKYKIKTTWFIPGESTLPTYGSVVQPYAGHSLETFPKEMAAVRDAGHEMYVAAGRCTFVDVKLTCTQRTSRIFARGTGFIYDMPEQNISQSLSLESSLNDIGATKGYPRPHVPTIDEVQQRSSSKGKRGTLVGNQQGRVRFVVRERPRVR